MNQNNSEELKHYGVLGMKWGVRRSTQNSSSNGSRTKKSKKINPFAKKRLKQGKQIAEAGSTIVNELGKLNRKNQTKHRQKLDLSSMTDQELRAKINREHLERQYNDIFNPAQVSKGRETVGKILEGAGTALTITGSALAIAVAIKELRG